MRFFSLIVCLASLCSAVPAPTSIPSAADNHLQPVTASEAYHTYPAGLPERIRNALAEINEPKPSDIAPGVVPTAVAVRRGVSKRTLIDDGHKYSIAGWVFTIGNIWFREIGSTTWKFPPMSDWSSRNWLADDVATSIRSVFGDGFHEQNIGGGWTWTGTLVSGYEFQDIPYEVLWRVFMDAIETADEWISTENYLAFTMIDNAGVFLGSFELYPTNGDMSNYWNAHFGEP